MRLRVFIYVLVGLSVGIALSCDKSDKSLDATGAYKGEAELRLEAGSNVTIDELKRYDETFESSGAVVAKNITESKAVVVTFTLGFIPAGMVLDFEQTSSDDSGAKYSVKEKEVIKSETGLIRHLVVKDAQSASFTKSGKKKSFNFVLNVEATLQIKDFPPVEYKGTLSFTTKE